MTDIHQPLRDALKAGPTSAIYTHPRDDNKWKENDAFARACTPEAISALLADLDAAVKALDDAAASIETISRLAGKAIHPNGVETCMGTFPEVRGYATSRAGAARAALTQATASEGEPTFSEVQRGTPGMDSAQRWAEAETHRLMKATGARSGDEIYKTLVELKRTAQPAPAARPMPDVLFDGFAVLKALDPKAQARTSAENVSDVLDAVVRLIRSQPTAPAVPAVPEAVAALSKNLKHSAIVVSDWMREGCDTNDIPRPHIAVLVTWAKESAHHAGTASAPTSTKGAEGESEYQRGYRHGYNQRHAEVLGDLA